VASSGGGAAATASPVGRVGGDLGGGSDARSVGAGSDDSGDARHVVPALDPSLACAACGEPFTRGWDEGEEGWVVRGAVALGGEEGLEDGLVYHVACAAALGPQQAAALRRR